mmetsp:Transcript_54040/g.105711  ORF Transcript_54040/g.105711 Transcript_54040/m.105711 type:complete len:311 (-) Transcript_54040:646-1578(-)
MKTLSHQLDPNGNVLPKLLAYRPTFKFPPGKTRAGCCEPSSHGPRADCDRRNGESREHSLERLRFPNGVKRLLALHVFALSEGQTRRYRTQEDIKRLEETAPLPNSLAALCKRSHQSLPEIGTPPLTRCNTGHSKQTRDGKNCIGVSSSVHCVLQPLVHTFILRRPQDCRRMRHGVEISLLRYGAIAVTHFVPRSPQLLRSLSNRVDHLSVIFSAYLRTRPDAHSKGLSFLCTHRGGPKRDLDLLAVPAVWGTHDFVCLTEVGNAPCERSGHGHELSPYLSVPTAVVELANAAEGGTDAVDATGVGRESN